MGVNHTVICSCSVLCCTVHTFHVATRSVFIPTLIRLGFCRCSLCSIWTKRVLCFDVSPKMHPDSIEGKMTFELRRHSLTISQTSHIPTFNTIKYWELTLSNQIEARIQQAIFILLINRCGIHTRRHT